MKGRSWCEARAALQTPQRWHLLKSHPNHSKRQNLCILRPTLVQFWPIPTLPVFFPSRFGLFFLAGHVAGLELQV